MTRYCVDTSSLPQAWAIRYPIDVFPGVWDCLEQLITSRRLVASEMVLDELRRKSDPLTQWANAHPEMFIDVDEAQSNEVGRVVKRYPRLIDQRKGRNRADPFVIALASLSGMVCVTEEAHGTENKLRIPYVCNELSVECISLVEVLRRERCRLLLAAVEV